MAEHRLHTLGLGATRVTVLACLFGLLLAGCAGLPPRGAPAVSRALAANDIAATTLAGVVANTLGAPPTARLAMPPEATKAPLAAVALAPLGVADEEAMPSGFRLLPEASFAWDARVALMRNAEKSLDVQYYHIEADELGLNFLRELRDAALRGVRVRLLVDDLHSAGGEADEILAGLAAVPGVEVRVFNPLAVRRGGWEMRFMASLYEFRRINRRMHNKLLLADNSLAVSGGRNIAGEYFMHNSKANFVDMDVLSSGAVVAGLSDVFDTYWNSEHAFELAALTGQASVHADASASLARRAAFDARVNAAQLHVPGRERDVLGHTRVSVQIASGKLEQHIGAGRVLADHPGKVNWQIGKSLEGTVTAGTLKLLREGRQEVVIVSPYLVPNQDSIASIKVATHYGVRMVLITNSLGSTDEPLVYWRYAERREEMVRAGVKIYEISANAGDRADQLGNFGQSARRLHAKVAVIDRRQVIVGSLNLDGRSAMYNTEVVLVIDSPALAGEAVGLMGNGQRFTNGYAVQLNASGSALQWVQTHPDGRVVVHDSEPDGDWTARFKHWLLSPFLPDEYL